MPLSRCFLFVVLGLLGAQAETAKDDGPKSSPEQRLIFARKAAGEYRFRLSERDKVVVKLHPEPLLRWNNQVVREDDGMLFLWTEGEKGPPVATAQFFVFPSSWHHEFQSLSQSGFDARYEGDGGAGWAWQPTRAGIDLVVADKIDAPAESPALRLRQMRNIAERFTAAVDQNEKFESPEQLRLLTTPVYRYSSTEQGILDGALFAFVQGTNPEVLILIEASGKAPADRVWRYGFGRMSCFNLRVHRGDRLVWKGDRAPVPTPNRASPYFFRLNAQPDTSADVEVPAAKAKKE